MPRLPQSFLCCFKSVEFTCDSHDLLIAVLAIVLPNSGYALSSPDLVTNACSQGALKNAVSKQEEVNLLLSSALVSWHQRQEGLSKMLAIQHSITALMLESLESHLA